MCDVMYSPSIFSHLFFMIFSKSFTLQTRSIHVYLHIPMCLKDFVVFPDILSLPLLSVQHISFFADIKHMAYPAMLLCYAAVPDPALPRPPRNHCRQPHTDMDSPACHQTVLFLSSQIQYPKYAAVPFH